MEAEFSLAGALSFMTFMISVSAGAYAWITSRDKATRQDIDHLRSEVRDLESRMGRTENELAHLPDKESLHRVELAVSEVRGDLRSMLESWAPVQRTVTRLEEYLMDKPAPRDTGSARKTTRR